MLPVLLPVLLLRDPFPRVIALVEGLLHQTHQIRRRPHPHRLVLRVLLKVLFCLY
jgi:hypothetical protein